MALTTEQLATIKTKVETDKILPIKAIRELFPDEVQFDVRKQLFEEYDREELLTHSRVIPTTLTNEEKITRIDRQLLEIDNRLAQVEKRKAKLLAEKAELEA
jgi:hypothetical protein